MNAMSDFDSECLRTIRGFELFAVANSERVRTLNGLGVSPHNAGLGVSGRGNFQDK